MKNDIKPLEIMDVNNKLDSDENASSGSSNLSTTDVNNLNEMAAEGIASTSKEEGTVKQNNSEVSILEEIYLGSKSEDHLVTSTSQLSSPVSQEEPLNIEDDRSYRKNANDFVDSSDYETDSDKSDDDFDKLDDDFDKLDDDFDKLDDDSDKLDDGSDKLDDDSDKLAKDSSKLNEESDEDSDDSDDDAFFAKLHEGASLSNSRVAKTKGQFLAEDLPPVEDLQISASSTELVPMGFVLHKIIAESSNEFLVIVESDGSSNQLDTGSVLFLSSGTPLGKIHETFDKVCRPRYCIRFNQAEDISNLGVTLKQMVYYSPDNENLTQYVLVDELKNQKGSDASWKDNNEPPADQIEYSDDEQERMAKQKAKAKLRRRDQNLNDTEGKDVAPKKMVKSHASNSQERHFKRPLRNRFQTPTPSSPRSLYHSPQSFGLPPSSSDNFNSSSLPRPVELSPSPIPFPSRSVPSPQHHGSFPRSNGPSPHHFGSFPFSNVPTSPHIGTFSYSNVQSPQPVGNFSHSNVPSPQPVGNFSHRNVPSPHHFGTFSRSNVPSPQTFGSFPPSTYVIASPSHMAEPQNNVPLQQQILLQSHQPMTTLLSHPPPNYNSHQTSRTFVPQHQSFTPPTFGVVSTTRPTMQSISNQSFVNQELFSLGKFAPHVSLSGNLNISRSTNMTFINANQGQSYGMVQSNTDSSFMIQQYPPGNTQNNNNIHPPVSQAMYGPIQPLGQTSSFVPSQTPLNQQGLPTFTGPQPPMLPSQTPPLSHQPGLSVLHPPVLPCQPPPSTFQFCNVPIPRDPRSAQRYPF